MDRAGRLERWRQQKGPLVAPSLLACDFARVAEELGALEAAGAAVLHLDVMDGHFVPNFTYGPPVIKDWRGCTELPFDAHLMMSNPDAFVDAFIDAGCDQIAVHIEVLSDPTELLGRIKRAGCRTCLALNPPTAVERVLPYLDEVDSVLMMSVMPGHGGQSFDPSVLTKVSRIRQLRPELDIAIDGGINQRTAELSVAAGVTYLVAGTSVFGADGDYAAALATLAEGIRRGLDGGG